MVDLNGLRFLHRGSYEKESRNFGFRGTDLEAAVLKVGHHGSRFLHEEGFLQAIRPKLAVISCEGKPLRPPPPGNGSAP